MGTKGIGKGVNGNENENDMKFHGVVWERFTQLMAMRFPF